MSSNVLIWCWCLVRAFLQLVVEQCPISVHENKALGGLIVILDIIGRVNYWYGSCSSHSQHRLFSSTQTTVCFIHLDILNRQRVQTNSLLEGAIIVAKDMQSCWYKYEGNKYS